MKNMNSAGKASRRKPYAVDSTGMKMLYPPGYAQPKSSGTKAGRKPMGMSQGGMATKVTKPTPVKAGASNTATKGKK